MQKRFKDTDGDLLHVETFEKNLNVVVVTKHLVKPPEAGMVSLSLEDAISLRDSLNEHLKELGHE